MLADVFKKSTNRRLENYAFYPSHYVSTVALGWDAMLSMTKVKLILIWDADMYLLFSKRGGEVVFLIFSKDAAQQPVNILTSYDPKKTKYYYILLEKKFKWIHYAKISSNDWT